MDIRSNENKNRNTAGNFEALLNHVRLISFLLEAKFQC